MNAPLPQTPHVCVLGAGIVGPNAGELLAEANTRDETILTANVDLARSEAVRRIWPYLRDRRIDAYGDLLRRYRD